ncbi:Uncharacterised protein [Mycobacteroides abscessus subsp. abscessus]|nr:Uncharacterised protein [Mycobacteroides abscessus subsp. abscessus]
MNRGEGADRASRIEFGPQNSPSVAGQIHQQRPVAGHLRDRAAECGEQEVLERERQPATRVVEFGRLLVVERGRDSGQV